ncbi:MAG: TIGR02584 family CRISPR-associated protein, partial [Methanobacteriota archaeon]
SKGKEKVDQSIKDSRSPFVQLCQDYGFSPFDIKIQVELITDDQGKPLEDIRTREDNEVMARKIMEVVYRFTSEPQNRLFASLAGGRKTMSAYLALAMQLFGREQDRLTHVLIYPPALESDKNFFYPPPDQSSIETSHGEKIAAKDVRIDLAEIPVIRLRNVIKEEIAQNLTDYFDLITLSQFKIDELQQSIQAEWIVQDHQLRVRLGEKIYPLVTIPGKLAAIYHGIAEKSKAVLTDETFQDRLRQIYKEYYRERGFDAPGYGDTWDVIQLQKDISTIRNLIQKDLPHPLAKLLSIQSKRSYEITEYFIPHPPDIIPS